MIRARRHPRLASAAAFVLLALAAELAGRSLTHQIDVGRHFSAPHYSGAGYYPFLLAGVKLGIALLLARLAWRFVKARSTVRAARRMAHRLGRHQTGPPPRLRLRLSPRLWAGAFAITSVLYLVQMDAERLSQGRSGLLAPLLHTSALSVFAVLSVFVALIWGAVAGWLSAYERYAEASLARAERRIGARVVVARPRMLQLRPPRLLFGLAFESRPPPHAA